MTADEFQRWVRHAAVVARIRRRYRRRALGRVSPGWWCR